MLLANTPTHAKSLIHSLEQAARNIGLHMNSNKTEYMCFQQEGTIWNEFMYLGSSVSLTENDVDICLVKVWTTIDRLLIIRKSDQSNKIKWDFFLAVTVSILLYGCTTQTLTKHVEKKLERNYTRMLWDDNETTAVQPLTSYFKNDLRKMNKICRILLEKQG